MSRVHEIKTMRIQKGLTQEKLGKLTKTNQTFISNVESLKIEIDEEQIEEIINAIENFDENFDGRNEEFYICGDEKSGFGYISFEFDNRDEEREKKDKLIKLLKVSIILISVTLAARFFLM